MIAMVTFAAVMPVVADTLTLLGASLLVLLTARSPRE